MPSRCILEDVFLNWTYKRVVWFWAGNRVALERGCLNHFVAQTSAGVGYKENKKVTGAGLKEACSGPPPAPR